MVNMLCIYAHYLYANDIQLSALAKASNILPRGDYPIAKRCIEVANGVVDFIRSNMWDEGTKHLTRSWREGRGPTGQTDDYAFLISGR